MTTADQYLKTIYVLQQASDTPASTGDVADRLGVSSASANEMIGKLVNWGLVTHEKYTGTVVTEAGEHQARTLVETYCVIQCFLHTVLDVDDYRREARAIEAVLDPTVAEDREVLARAFRGRWGVETQYRQFKHEFYPPTKSSVGRVRAFHFNVAQLFYNIWVLVNLELRDRYDLSDRRPLTSDEVLHAVRDITFEMDAPEE